MLSPKGIIKMNITAIYKGFPGGASGKNKKKKKKKKTHLPVQEM